MSVPPAARTVESVDHTVAILRVLESTGRTTALDEIAREVRLSRPSVRQLLRTLEQERFVRRDADGYRLGPRAYEVGASVPRSVDLIRVARPFLDPLAEHVGAPTLLSVLDEQSVRHVDRGQWRDPVRVPGRHGSLHTSAAGKVLLAHQSTDVQNAVLDSGLPASTAGTIVCRQALAIQLVWIRRVGYATCWEEGQVGVNGVAVPLCDHRGEVSAAISIVGPDPVVTRASVGRLAAVLGKAVGGIGAALGASADPASS